MLYTALTRYYFALSLHLVSHANKPIKVTMWVTSLVVAVESLKMRAGKKPLFCYIERKSYLYSNNN